MKTESIKRGRYTPIDPVVLSTIHPCPNKSKEGLSVSGIAGDNSDLMQQVAKLWICPSDVVVDVTFGKGVFWKKIEGLPTYSHDLKIDGVDCRNLPYKNGSVDVLVLDPPYRPNHGSLLPNSHALSECYGLGNSNLDSMNDVISLYASAMREAARIVKRGGRILVKCQDMTYGHKLHLVSMDVLRTMVGSGFEFADQFILVNRTQLSSGQWNRQERARRSHSILWVGVRV